jgi:hypothetical protein
MGFRDFFRSDNQKIAARVPAAYRRLQWLQSAHGVRALTVWLEDLARVGSLLRAARGMSLMAHATRQGCAFDLPEDSRLGIWDSVAASEWDWWAAQTVYNSGRSEGYIDSGPDMVPGLWSEGFSEFSKEFYPSQGADVEEVE